VGSPVDLTSRPPFLPSTAAPLPEGRWSSPSISCRDRITASGCPPARADPHL